MPTLVVLTTLLAALLNATMNVSVALVIGGAAFPTIIGAVLLRFPY